MKKNQSDQEKLKIANNWISEGQWASSEWRAESWRDCENYDGGDAAWSQDDWDEALNAGIDPITVNRTFSGINKLAGSQVVNRFEIIAKARTKDDGEISQVMSEGLKFVSDQYGGEFLISHAHSDALIPGFGCLAPCFNPDPRKERVSIKYRDWKEVGWDPFSPPWWSTERTRYVYWRPWVDLEDFQAIFPGREREIEGAYNELAGDSREQGYSSLMDEAQLVEEKIRTLSSAEWVDGARKRIRPVELWYPVNEKCMFSLFADGRCYEIKDGMETREAWELIKNGVQTLHATVKKMRVMTFFGEHLILQDQASPYDHDQYPMVPFVGYIDRWGFPYGVPRQTRGLAKEVNKRRSMALAMLKKRRTLIEESAVSPKGDNEQLDKVHEEVNKLDGMAVLADGGLQRIEIEELAQLSQFQIDLMRQTEFEMRDIMGSDSPISEGERGQSGVAKQKDTNRAAMSTATLLDNLRRSMKMLGEQTGVNIQSSWTYEKVLRVTDRLSGAERFITVNEKVNGGPEIRNNITQHKFDYIVSEAPITDTTREKNLDLLYVAIEKSPPEAAPTLLIAAFEISDLPNKDVLIEKLKPVLGVDPEEEDMTPEDVKAKILAELKAQQEQAKLMNDLEMEGLRGKLNEQKLQNVKLEAEIQKIQAETQETVVDTEIKADEHEDAIDKRPIEGLEKGLDIKERVEGKQEKANAPT